MRKLSAVILVLLLTLSLVCPVLSATTGGYTGDVYCLDCKERITAGTATAATGHCDPQKEEAIKTTPGTH